MKENKTTKHAAFLSKTYVVWLGALICCSLWGSAFPSIKTGYRVLGIAASDTASQILFAGCRFFLAGILAVILGSLLQRKLLVPRLDEIPKIAWLSVWQTMLQYLFFYIGLSNTTGVKSSIVNATNVFFAVLLAAAVFREERLSTRKIVGCILGFAGVVLVNLNGASIDTGMKFTGEGFILLSAMAYGCSSVFLKKYSRDHNPVMFSGYQFALGGGVMILVGLAMGGRLGAARAEGVLLLLYLAFVSAVAYSLWGILLKYNPVSKVAVFGFMTPVFGVLLSALFLDESQALGGSVVAALVLVSAGIYIVNRDTWSVTPKKND